MEYFHNLIDSRNDSHRIVFYKIEDNIFFDKLLRQRQTGNRTR